MERSKTKNKNKNKGITNLENTAEFRTYSTKKTLENPSAKKNKSMYNEYKNLNLSHIKRTPQLFTKTTVEREMDQCTFRPSINRSGSLSNTRL
jgi:hypothetical protein